jgi:hypothetical protein
MIFSISGRRGCHQAFCLRLLGDGQKSFEAATSGESTHDTFNLISPSQILFLSQGFIVITHS